MGRLVLSEQRRQAHRATRGPKLVYCPLRFDAGLVPLIFLMAMHVLWLNPWLRLGLGSALHHSCYKWGFSIDTAPLHPSHPDDIPPMGHTAWLSTFTWNCNVTRWENKTIMQA